MEKGKFYISKENINSFKKENCYMLIDLKKIDDKNFHVKIGQVFAILMDRVIFSDTLEFITDKPYIFFKNFKEISLKEAKNFIDNTHALLDKNIFRR